MDAVSIPEDRPKRGYRWVVLAVLMVVLMVSYVVRLLWPHAAVQARIDLALSPTVMGGFITAFYAGYVSANVASGFLADRFGARRTLTAAALLLALFTCAFSLVGDAFEGLCVQFLMGLASGAFFSASAKTLVNHFSGRERGLAFGLMASPASVAIIFSNTVFPSAVSAWRWPAVYLFTGLAVLPIAAVCALILRDTTGTPSPVRRSGFAEGVAESFRELMLSRDLILIAVAGFAGNWASWGFTFWAAPLLIEAKGLSAVDAGSVVALAGLGAAASKPACGLLSDLLRERRRVAIGCLVAFTVLLGVFALPQSLTGYRLLGPLVGFTAFGFSPLFGAMITERVAHERVGAATGFGHALAQGGNLAAPIVVGAVFGATASFAAALATMAVGSALAAGAMILAGSGRVGDPLAGAERRTA